MCRSAKKLAHDPDSSDPRPEDREGSCFECRSVSMLNSIDHNMFIIKLLIFFIINSGGLRPFQPRQCNRRSWVRALSTISMTSRTS